MDRESGESLSEKEVTDAPKLVATVAWHEAVACNIERQSINAMPWEAGRRRVKQTVGGGGGNSLVTIERHSGRQHCSESSDHQILMRVDKAW